MTATSQPASSGAGRPPLGRAAVLLPLRLETRFLGTRLRVRVIPDEPWFDRHDPLASAEELDGLERYLAAAGDDHETPRARAAWQAFAERHGPARAAWLVRTFPPAPGLGGGRVARPPGLREDALLASIADFPAELQVWIVFAGGQRAQVATMPVRADRLLLDPPDLDRPEPDPDEPDPDDPDRPSERRWWESWGEAVIAGLATEIELGERAGDIAALYVVGLTGTTPAALFAKHRDAGRLGLLAPGTPTNTVDGAPAADLGDDPRAWLELLHRAARDTERHVSFGLTGDADLLGPLPGDPRPHHDWASELLTGMWPALLGHTLTHVLGIGAAIGPVAEWATRDVDPLGPYPTVRVGGQPYGVLPATSLGDWVPHADVDPPFMAALREPLIALRSRWARAAIARGRGPVATTDPAERMLRLLAQPPASPGYALRRMYPMQLWLLALLATGHPIRWRDFLAEWEETYQVGRELGLRPRRRYSARNTTRRLRLPPVTPGGLPEEVRVGTLLQRLFDLATQTPSAFATTGGVEEAIEAPTGSLLLRLAIRSLQVAIGEVGREKLNVPPGTLEPISVNLDVPPPPPQLLSEWISAVTPADLAAETGPGAAARRVAEAFRRLRVVPPADLERLLPATIDCATHRIDPWVAGLARHRWRRIAQRTPPLPPRLGAYGWVDNPRPGRPGPTDGRLLHAPSAAQALTAALIRDRAINDPEPGRWHMDITSARARRAARLADEIRRGAHPAEALGREVERAVGDPVSIGALRRDFPIRVAHAGRRTCDGQRVLAADPATLNLPAATLDELAELREAIDVYADLLVAEAVQHVVEGRTGTAGAALDAAAGLARPPDFEVLRTRRAGRPVETSCLIVAPDVAPPPVPADPAARAAVRPARLADAATAALVASRVGAARQWQWEVAAPGGPPSIVTLDDLGLEPAEALALPLGTLERLVLAAVPGAEVTDPTHFADRDGSIRYERAVRLAALLGRVPATAGDTTEATGASPVAADPAELRDRLRDLRAVARALADRLAAAEPAARPAALRLATRWGIAPEPDPVATDPLADQAGRAHRQLTDRLAAAAAESLDHAGLAAAIAALASPTGQFAVLGRLRRDALPALHESGGLDAAWLTQVAPVRPPLARLEAFQLAAGTPAGIGTRLAAWTNRPADPWQADAADARRLVAAYAPRGLDLAAAPPGERLAVGLLDRFAETIPDAEHDTTGAFGFNGPGARAPQAILLAVPPDPVQELDAASLVGIVAETRELARARMATLADLDEIDGLAPLPLVPATGDVAGRLEG